jgi:hypothetical protein
MPGHLQQPSTANPKAITLHDKVTRPRKRREAANHGRLLQCAFHIPCISRCIRQNISVRHGVREPWGTTGREPQQSYKHKEA